MDELICSYIETTPKSVKDSFERVLKLMLRENILPIKMLINNLDYDLLRVALDLLPDPNGNDKILIKIADAEVVLYKRPVAMVFP